MIAGFLPVVSDEELMLSLPREVSFIAITIVSLAGEMRIEQKILVGIGNINVRRFTISSFSD